MKRKLILNLAISLDGYIADEEGGFAWIVGDGDKSNDTEDQSDFSKFLESIGIIVMGRKAYEDCPDETMSTFNSKKIYVPTSKKLESKYDNVEFINRNICEQILKEGEEGGKSIWIYGGGKLADAFIKADVIDEYIIGIIPIILGKGRPLFLENNPTIKLHLDHITVTEGIAVMKYTKRKNTKREAKK